MVRPIITSRRKRVIIDVDTQRHFFLDTSIVCVRNHRQVLANIQKVVSWARLKNIHIISTVQMRTGNNFYCNSYIGGMAGRKKIGCTLCKSRTCFDADGYTDLPPEVLEHYDQVIFRKRCFDPFEEPRADRMLSELQADELILIGAATEGAVKATALGLLARHKNVTVLVDATGSYKKTVGEVALRHILESGGRLTETGTILGHSFLRLMESYNLGRC